MAAKKVLLTGSNGLLGQKILDEYGKRGGNRQIVACSRGLDRYKGDKFYSYEPLDITNQEEVVKVLRKHKPDTIIHSAAMTNVDACENDPLMCEKSNVDSVQFIVDELKALKGKDYDPHLIHVSTDFIFDGENGPYLEEDVAKPVSIYGESKLKAEQIVKASGLPSAILRTILLYGVVNDMSRSNIVLWAKGALEKGSPINVVDDQFRTPTLAEDLAVACILAEEKRAEGIYHISGEEMMSIIDLVKRVADFWKLDKSLINPVSSSALNQPAKRPPRTGFIIEKAKRVLGYEPHSFEEGLRVVDEQLKVLAGR